MLRQIRGTVSSVEDGGLVIDVSGFGVYVAMASTASHAEGATVSIPTYLAVKQDGLELYGFESIEDRRFFELALSVSGIGPKTALSLLRRAPRESLEDAIARRDIPYLTRVVGLGKKSAEKLVVEIAEKMGAATSSDAGEDAEVFDTLIALGYTEREARAAVKRIPQETVGKDARLRAALSAK